MYYLPLYIYYYSLVCFSWHEIAIYDLPAMIDYALKLTGEKVISYIGHSMGTTVSYVLLSMKPLYNQKIRFAMNLAPIALWKVPPTTFYPINKPTYDLAKVLRCCFFHALNTHMKN